METKLNFVVLAMAMLFFLVSPISTLAFFDNPNEKANKLITEGINLKKVGLNDDAKYKLKKAKVVLTEELGKNPNNSEALFTFGKLFYAEKNYNKAQRMFSLAFKKNPNLGDKTYNFYMAEAEKYAENENLNFEIKAKVAAYNFRPQLKAGKAKKFAETGKTTLLAGNFKNANLFFRAANSLDQRIEITYFFEQAVIKESDPKSQIMILQTAVKFAKRVQTVQAKKVAITVGRRFKQAKIKKAVVEKELNELPKSYRLIIVKINWPPTWKTTLAPKEFTGNGMKWKQWIQTVEFGKDKDFVNGDIVTVYGNDFLVDTKGEWKGPTNGKLDIKIENCGPGHVLVKSPKGKTFRVGVKKLL